ncbi:MAG: FHA domain-containing protein [Methylacidiphilales bacterium]|nr:FHA domain-containing protein [Candidatus Methylacidiphilales bacterium]
MAGKLVITIDTKSFGEFELTKSITTIGRKSDNDIPINYPLVSSKHCQILSVSSDWFIEDLNSTNGTCINGKIIKKSGLQNNDVISIGNCEIKFLNIADSDSSEDESDATVIYTNQQIPKANPSAIPNFQAQNSNITSQKNSSSTDFSKNSSTSTVVSNSSSVKGKLQILNGVNSGKEMELQKQLTTIGKPGVQVAALTKRAQGYFIIHVDGPANSFPTVNGKSIGTQAHQLNDHDLIEVAGIKMEFFLG